MQYEYQSYATHGAYDPWRYIFYSVVIIKEEVGACRSQTWLQPGCVCADCGSLVGPRQPQRNLSVLQHRHFQATLGASATCASPALPCWRLAADIKPQQVVQVLVQAAVIVCVRPMARKQRFTCLGREFHALSEGHASF